LQLLGGATRLGLESAREQDFHGWSEEPGPGTAIACLVQDPADSRRCVVTTTLREPQQGHAWMWRAARVACQAVRLLCFGELPAQSMDLRELVVGGARRSAARRLCELIAGAPGLVLRIRPEAAQHFDLGASNETFPAIRNQVGLGLAPVAERLGPFLHAAHVEQLEAGLDDAAVDGADDDGRSSPEVTATITSSISATPSSTAPSRTIVRARPCWARLRRSRSPKRSPMTTACAKMSRALSKSVSMTALIAEGTSR
jgi:hypothetical protein